ncbi:MAG: stage V sporulation protein AD [Candidatus Coprovivens sp.]
MSSFKYNNVYIKDYHTIVGPKEKEGLIKFNDSINDYYYNETSIEDAEIKMQEHVLNKIMINNKLVPEKVNLVCGGDLTNQITMTSYNLVNRNLPFLGLYNACATFNEALILISNMIETKQIETGVAITSSHNLNAERQYRYPIEYGFNKKPYSTFTTTGAASCLLTSKRTNLRIESSTIGTVVDYGIKDANNMGAIMAPSAAATLYKHLTELNRPINYYDLIVTGDLGSYGSKLFLSLIKQDYNYMPSAYMDAASTLYDNEANEIEGGSGPVVVPLVLFNKILKETNYKKILLLATGSLHSPLMVNLKKSIPSITHAVSIEVIK